jgi:large subunit ribosomal protein L14
MILKESKLKITDNSGALRARCIHAYRNQTTQLGNFLKVVLTRFDSRKKLHKKKKYLGLVVTTKQQNRRRNGTFIRFSENRALLFADEQKFLGSRIHSPLCRELKKKLPRQQVSKLVSASSGLI